VGSREPLPIQKRKNPEPELLWEAGDDAVSFACVENGVDTMFERHGEGVMYMRRPSSGSHDESPRVRGTLASSQGFKGDREEVPNGEVL